jgi:hypothetical protein
MSGADSVQWMIDTCNNNQQFEVCQDVFETISGHGELIHMLDLDIQETELYSKDHIDMMKMDKVHAEKELEERLNHAARDLFYTIYIK